MLENIDTRTFSWEMYLALPNIEFRRQIVERTWKQTLMKIL